MKNRPPNGFPLSGGLVSALLLVPPLARPVARCAEADDCPEQWSAITHVLGFLDNQLPDLGVLLNFLLKKVAEAHNYRSSDSCQSENSECAERAVSLHFRLILRSAHHAENERDEEKKPEQFGLKELNHKTSFAEDWGD